MIRMFCALVLVLAHMSGAHAQAPPPPVDLQIPNIPQQTPVWCWAAVAQQIIHARHGPARTPAQCALVANGYGAHPAVCCQQPNPQCLRTGSFPQIAALIHAYGGLTSRYALPADPMAIYQTLSSGRAIILHVKADVTGMTGNTHVVVLRGMSFSPTPYGFEAILHINDPMAYFTQPVPFSRLVPIWLDALVVG